MLLCPIIAIRAKGIGPEGPPTAAFKPPQHSSRCSAQVSAAFRPAP
ncbi:DUF6053 domain-containing protein [Lysobacter enzymogenes]